MVSGLIGQRNLVLLLLVILLQACAHSRMVPQTAEATTSQTPQPPSDIEIARQQISKLQDRVQDLEVRLSALNDKINLENGSGNTSTTSSASAKMPDEAVEAPAAHAKVVPAKKLDRKSKTEVGETTAADADEGASTEAVDRFREAKILYDSKRYSDSVLEFSEFVKNESEHPLAPAAQYYVGMSYLKQNEYKLAEEELSRGLIAYPHSNYVPDTLLALSDVSGSLKKDSKVTYYREKLLNHFPNSPQAKSLTEAQSPAKMMASKEEPSVVEKAVEKSDEKSIEKPEAPTVSVPSIEADKSEAP